MTRWPIDIENIDLGLLRSKASTLIYIVSQGLHSPSDSRTTFGEYVAI